MELTVKRCGEEWEYTNLKAAARQLANLQRIYGNPSSPETAIRVYAGDRELRSHERDALLDLLLDGYAADHFLKIFSGEVIPPSLW